MGILFRGTEILKRMAAGQVLESGAQFPVFQDGQKVSPVTVAKLAKQGHVDQPQGGSVTTPWTLTDKGRKAVVKASWSDGEVVFRWVSTNSGETVFDTIRQQNAVGDGRVAKAFSRNVKAGNTSVGVTVVIARRPKGGQ